MARPSRARLIRACLLTLVCLSAWIVSSVESRRSVLPVIAGGELRVWFLDIGQGDAIFIETPDGHQLLIDGGPNDAVLAKLGAVMNPTDRTIDAILLTHPDADHVTGLVPVLERYDVATVYTTGLDKDTNVFDAFEEDIRLEGAQHPFLSHGDTLAYGDVQFEVLWPDRTYEGVTMDDPNGTSITLLMRYGETSVLFTGDASEKEEKVFGSRVGDIDVLKAGHHGSRTSSDPAFLDLIDPEFAVISCGVDNRYGHPSPDVLERFRERGIATFRTDLQHDILLRSTGGEPTLEAAPLPF